MTDIMTTEDNGTNTDQRPNIAAVIKPKLEKLTDDQY